MLRRLGILAALTVAAGTTLSAPAYAASNVICVGNTSGVTCNAKVATIQQAIGAANANGFADTIYVAPGHYNEGTYGLYGVQEPLTLQGSGQGSTFLELPAGGPQTYVTITDATLKDLTVAITGGPQSDGDIGISAIDSTIQRVTVDGPSTQNVVGIKITGGSVSASTVNLTRTEIATTHGIYGTGTTTVSDTSITASDGFHHTAAGTLATLSRLSIKASSAGISVQVGSVAVDDSLIELNTEYGGAGVVASNENNGTSPKSVVANHLTIIGGGSGSVGARAWSIASGAVQQTTVQLDNSIIRGPATGLDAQASNNGSLGSNSTATITTSYSDWSTKNTASGTGGTATITSGAGHLDVDPAFVNPAGGDYRLSKGSPVVDRGAPGAGVPTLDLDRHARVLDGTGDGIAVRDLGAYEAPKVPDVVAPGTAITSHPAKRLTKRRATFRFTSNESHVTFQCRMDNKAWASCASPRSYLVSRGWHTFRVRARDAAGNLDATPASWRFKRV
jgi:hypothetical protein